MAVTVRVKIDDIEFLIEFVYTQRPISDGHVYDANEVTLCIIRDGSAPREPKTPAPRLASGEAIRYFKDPPNREIGRKAALAKALDALLSGSNREAVPCVTPTKVIRRAFWKVYLNRKKGPPSSRELVAQLAVEEMGTK